MTFHASLGIWVSMPSAPVHRPKVSTHTDGTLGFTVATPRGGERHGQSSEEGDMLSPSEEAWRENLQFWLVILTLIHQLFRIDREHSSSFHREPEAADYRCAFLREATCHQ